MEQHRLARLDQLIGRIAGGDADALASLHDATSTVVFGLARHVLADAGAAEEATLDVFVQVWREAKRFDPKRGSVLSWLMNLARSRAIDRMRIAGGAAKRLERPLASANGTPALDTAPIEATWIGEQRERIAAALALLPPEQRQALECAFFLGMTHAEIAGHLAQPLGTIKTRIRTALQKLRDTLESLGAHA